MMSGFGNFAGEYGGGTLLTFAIVLGMIFLTAAVLAVARIIRGPSIMDRMIATDVLLATIMCGLGGFAAVSGRTDVLPVMLVIAMFGFVGSVGVSRYVSRSDMRTAPRYRRGRRRDTGAHVADQAPHPARVSTALPEEMLTEDAGPVTGQRAARRYEVGHTELEQASAEVLATGSGRLSAEGPGEESAGTSGNGRSDADEHVRDADAAHGETGSTGVDTDPAEGPGPESGQAREDR